MMSLFKGNLYTSKGDKSVKIRLALFSKQVYPKRKDFALRGSKFFPFTVDPF